MRHIIANYIQLTVFVIQSYLTNQSTSLKNINM